MDGGRRSAYEYLCDIDARSQAHVAGLPQDAGVQSGWRGLAYRIGTRRLLSTFAEVAEILTLPAVTPVPGGQHWVLGLANVRGNLLPVVDLKLFLDGERTVLHENQRMLTVKQDGGDVAVLIDELLGQRTFDDSHLADPADLAEGRYRHLIDRAYAQDGETWGVLSLDRLARTPEFRRAAT